VPHTPYRRCALAAKATEHRVLSGECGDLPFHRPSQYHQQFKPVKNFPHSSQAQLQTLPGRRGAQNFLASPPPYPPVMPGIETDTPYGVLEKPHCGLHISTLPEPEAKNNPPKSGVKGPFVWLLRLSHCPCPQPPHP